jgi:hypothetical protein
MSGESTAFRQTHKDLLIEVRQITEEIRPLTDSVDSLYILLQHIWQNREEFLDVLSDARAIEQAPDLPDEIVFCTACEKTVIGVAQALRRGWQCIMDDEGNERGNYAAMCQQCIEREDALPPQTDAEQQEFCCAHPDLRWDGQPEVPSVCCAQCGFTVVEAGQVVLPEAADGNVQPVVDQLLSACKAALAVEEQIGPQDSIVGRHEPLIEILRAAIAAAEPQKASRGPDEKRALSDDRHRKVDQRQLF